MNRHSREIKEVKLLIEKRVGKNRSHEWPNREFEKLSLNIKVETGVLISTATLKRVLGKIKTGEDYSPQEATIKAIEQYLSNRDSSNTIENIVKNRAKKRLYILITIAISTVVIFGLVHLIKGEDNSIIDSTDIHFSISKIEGKSPATAHFKYKIDGEIDNLLLHYGDGSPNEIIDKTKLLKTHYYRFPGLFNTYITDKSGVAVSDSTPLLIKTDGWQALAYYYEQEYSERYFPLSIDLASDSNIFHPTSNLLSSSAIDTSKIVVIRVDNFKETKTCGDNFNLNSRIKGADRWAAIRCYSIYISVVGDSGSISFNLTNEGCSIFNSFKIGDRYTSGTDTDLSKLTIDSKFWQDIEIENRDKRVTLTINKTVRLSEEYSRSIGDIVGVTVSFHGNGYIDYLNIRDREDNYLFKTDF